MALIFPSWLMMDASVEPAPKSSMAIGFAVPGVVKAPKIADSASSPPISLVRLTLFLPALQ